MTKHELIQAYADGDIGRRDFVRRLSALGVSSAAALAYAHSLAPRTAAAGGSAGRSGFVMRAQQDGDGEYGTAIQLGGDDEAVLSAVEAGEAVQDLLDEGLGRFSEDDFTSFNCGSPDVYDELQRLYEQRATHLEVLDSLFDQVVAAPNRNARLAGLSLQSDSDSPEEFLAKLRDALDVEAGLFTALVPAVEDGEVRQTMMSIASVKARHAAYVRTLTGRSGYPDAFEEAISPEEAAAQLEEIADR
jgi:hypothetical protein